MNASRHRRPAAFTLLEVVVSLALGSVVFAAALAGIVALQKSYAATEQYATNLADQTRLMDYLCMDLRRAVNATLLSDGLKITLPDYYATDANGQPTLPNSPNLYVSFAGYGDAPPGTAVTPDNLPHAFVFYHFRASFTDSRLGSLTKVITREEVRGGAGETGLSTASPASCHAIASGLAAFPAILFLDYTDTDVGNNFSQALKARLTLTFQPMFQTGSTPDNNLITLHGLTFLRNNDSRNN